MGPSGRRPQGHAWSLHVPLVLAPLGLAAASVIGKGERALLRTRIAAAAAARASAPPGASAGGLGVLWALLPLVGDILLLAWALRAFQRGLVRWVQGDGAFPVVPLLGLVFANVVCWACALPLGVIAVWGAAMALALWIFQGPLEYHDE